MQRSVRSIIRRLGKERGDATENRLFRAFDELYNDAPEWFYGIARATRKEDQKGIDAIVYSDVGKIFLQIKSSVSGARKFEAQTHRYPIAVIIIHVTDAPAEIRQKSYQAAGQMRNRIMQLRKGM